jgi:hypothetical protein
MTDWLKRFGQRLQCNTRHILSNLMHVKLNENRELKGLIGYKVRRLHASPKLGK